MSNSKEYILPNGKKAVFEYDVCGIGKITLECMDELMGMIADRPQGEWIFDPEILCPDIGVYSAGYRCSVCGKDYFKVDRMNYCPHCGARMRGADDESVDITLRRKADRDKNWWRFVDTPSADQPKITEEEIDTMLARVLVSGQTDCSWK